MSGPILVTDGGERAALAAVRSLGRAGHRVIVCSHSGRSLAGASRFAVQDVVVPHPLEHPDRFVESLEALCRREAVAFLIPVTDAALEAVLPTPDRFRPTRIPFPSFESYRGISDKRALMTKAHALGIPTPRELVLEHKGVNLPDGLAPSFPLFVKPARSVVSSGLVRRKTSVSYAADPMGLAEVLESYPKEAYPLLVQEHISGWGEGVFLLRWNGRIVARFAHRRIREKPPSGGVSVYRESIPLRSDVEAFSTALLDTYDWNGVAMIEFRRSAVDGRAYLMEVNGRFWGSLQLAIDAGVDFPRILIQCAQGQPPEAAPEYRTGIRSRWWMGDLDHLLIRLSGRYGRSPADRLPPGSGTTLQALLRFLVPWRPGDRSEVLRISDPRPGLRESGQWLRNLTRRKNGP